jgi:zinc and cadmium transporter
MPHKISNVFILMHIGHNPTTAVLLNGISASFSIIGCVIGLALGEYFSSVSTYFVPVAAGQFLYVSLAQLLPELLSIETRKCRISGTVGFILGIAIIGSLVNIPLFHE